MMSRFTLIFFALLATHATADPVGRPRPLPRPELQALPIERLQQIQGVSHAVLAVTATPSTDPRAAALRQVLLDMRGEIASILAPAAPTESPRESPSACLDAACDEATVAPPPAMKTERLVAKRQTLAAVITPMAADPQMAHLATAARAIDAKIAAAIAAGDFTQMRALFHELEPKSLAQMRPQATPIIEPTFRTLTRHKPGVKGIHPEK